MQNNFFSPKYFPKLLLLTDDTFQYPTDKVTTQSLHTDYYIRK